MAVLLALDLLVFHRHDRVPSLRESAGWTVFWCSLAAAFNGLVWWGLGREAGMAFLTGYVIEWSLSMDNVFVFAVIFRFFQVPVQYQYRVLFWGILGAIVLRLAFVLAGTQLIRHFDWVLPLFGLLLIYTARRLAWQAGGEVHPEKSLVLRAARRLLPVSRGDHHQHGNAFFVREDGRLCITPLFLVLLVVESTDVLFAVDSVPAIFGITLDPFIVFTSNIFAILGLRALYFLLAGAISLLLLALWAGRRAGLRGGEHDRRLLSPARRPAPDSHVGKTVGHCRAAGHCDRGIDNGKGERGRD